MCFIIELKQIKVFQLKQPLCLSVGFNLEQDAPVILLLKYTKQTHDERNIASLKKLTQVEENYNACTVLSRKYLLYFSLFKL